MSIGAMDRQQASARVVARLGRPPQDVLEAAVVLEAWGGVRPRSALTLASAPREVPHRLGSIPLPTADQPNARGSNVLGLLVLVLATTAWTVSFAGALGATGLARAWQVGLPLTLALYYAARRRYPQGPEGVGVLRRDRVTTALSAVAALAAVVVVLTDVRAGFPLALALTWLGGALLVERGWWYVYGGLLALSAGAILLHLAPDATVAATLLLLLLCVAVAVRSAPTSNDRPLPSGPVARAALLGGLGGLLLVSGPFLGGPAGGATLLAVMPSLAGGVWAGRYSSRIWQRLPHAMTAVDVRRRNRRAPLRRAVAAVLLAALARLVAATLVLSLGLHLVLVAVHVSTAVLDVSMVELGVLAAILFLAGLLDAFRRPWGSALVLVTALVLVHALQVAPAAAFPSSAKDSLPVLVAGLCSLVLGACLLNRVFDEPDRAYALML
jgi:hypothetical protein